MSILKDFLEQDADKYCKRILLDAIAELQADTVREFTFNRFNVRLVGSTAMAEIEDEFEVSLEGQCSLTLDQFKEALAKHQ